MDPVSAFGVASGALQTIHFIASSINTLWVLHGKYSEAERTIYNLISVLSTIQTALSHLREWIQRDTNTSLDNPDCLRSLNVAVQGCLATMEAFSDDINEMVPTGTDSAGFGGQLGFRARAKLLWSDQKMADHQERLQLQLVALQLFLQVCQCQTSSEQLELLRREGNRRLIKQVADDAATLRSSRSTDNSVADVLSVSGQSAGSSSVGSTVFDFDETVMNSTAYRPITQQRLQKRRQEHPENTPNRRPSATTLETVDEGYASGYASGQKTARPSLRVPQESREPDRSPAISPVEGFGTSILEDRTRRRNTTALARSSSAAYTLPRSKSARHPPGLKRSPSARELFRAAFNRVGSRDSGPTSPSDARPSRRNGDGEMNVSIETSSPTGVLAPPIVKAAQRGALMDVETQIKSGADVEARHDESGRTALAVAAHCGKEEVVDLLLNHGAEPHSRDSSFMIPLHLAASRGHLGVVDRLIEVTANIDERDNRGRTPFWIAAEAGHIKTAEVFLSSGCKINSRGADQMTPLHCASRQGDLDIVSCLLRHRIDIHAKDATMKTALHYASETGHTRVVDMLLRSGARIDSPAEDRTTPLICAAAMGQGLTTQLLIKKGAIVGASDDNGMSALHWAAFNGHLEIVELLLSKKALLRSITSIGRTALHLAILGKQFAVVEYLLRSGARVENECSEGLTALHYGCKSNDVSMVRLLLASGANIEAPANPSQRRPIHIAVQAESLDIVMFLKAKGAQIHPEDRDGNRPLSMACRSGQVEIVRLLLNAGALPQSRDNTENPEHSPICLAAIWGSIETVRLLLDAGASASECDHMGWNSLLYSAHYGHISLLNFLLSRCDLSAKQRLVISFPSIGFTPNIHMHEECKESVKARVLDLSAELAHRRMLVKHPNPSFMGPINPSSEGFSNHSTRSALGNHVVGPVPTSSLVGPTELESSEVLLPYNSTTQAEYSVAAVAGSENHGAPASNGHSPSPFDLGAMIQPSRPRPVDSILSSETRADSPASVVSQPQSSVSPFSGVIDSNGYVTRSNDYLPQIQMQRYPGPPGPESQQSQTNGNSTSGIASGSHAAFSYLPPGPPLPQSHTGLVGPVDGTSTERNMHFQSEGPAYYELDGGEISDSGSVASFETAPELKATERDGNV